MNSLKRLRSPATWRSTTPTALPAFSLDNFTVTWSGSDNAGGSGLAGYDVYVYKDGGVFTLWQSAVAQTSASFTGGAIR